MPQNATALTRPLLLLMCVATGLCAGANYFNQPLLEDIGQALRVPSATAALSVTVSQGFYALGLVLLAPLGDLLERRRLTVGLILLTAAGQALTGFAPSFGVFLLGVAVASLFSVAAQVLVPYASVLAPEGRGGAAVGTVMSGLLSGVLLARAVAGILSDLGGWILVYRLTALVMVGIALALWRVLPPSRSEDPPSYPGLFLSMGRLLRTQPRLRLRSLLSGISFASLSAVFATTTLLLAGQRFGLSATAIGLISLTGLAGTLSANLGGQLVDRGRGRLGTVLGLGLSLAGWCAFWLGGHSVAWFCVGMVLLDAGVQLVHLVSMNTVYALVPAARSRLNSVYMTFYFIGAAVGSGLGVMAWRAGHWEAVCLLGLVLTVLCWAVSWQDARHEARTLAQQVPGV